VITVGGKTIHPSAPPDIQGRTILFSRSVGHHEFVVERSEDGGRTWTESVPFAGAGTPRMIDAKHLYLGVGEGAAAGSEGGALTSGRTGAIDIVSRKVVWLFGRIAGNSPRFPRVFRTVDAGRRWTSIHLPVAIGDDNLDAVTSTMGFVASKAVIWRTTNGGRNWTTIHAVIAQR
jgi:hypothetical protein